MQLDVSEERGLEGLTDINDDVRGLILDLLMKEPANRWLAYDKRHGDLYIGTDLLEIANEIAEYRGTQTDGEIVFISRSEVPDYIVHLMAPN